MNRQWVLKEEKPDPAKIGHPNLVGLVYPFLGSCEFFLATISIVVGYIVIAENGSPAYSFLRSFLNPLIGEFFSRFPYLDHYFTLLKLAGQNERMSFVQLGVTSIWIAGVYGAFKVMHGMMQGWVYHLRYLKLARFEIVKQLEIKLLALSAIAFLMPILVFDDLFGSAERNFLSIRNLPIVGQFYFIGFWKCLWDFGALLMCISVFCALFIYFIIAFLAILWSGALHRKP